MKKKDEKENPSLPSLVKGRSIFPL